MKPFDFIPNLAAAAWLACLPGCIGGSSSETDGFTPKGYIQVTPGRASLTGTTDSGIFVGLYAMGYRPYNDSGFADTAKADAHGDFTFAGLPPGDYNLLARDTASGKAAFLAGISVAAAMGGAERKAQLAIPGRLRGAIKDSLPLVGPLRVYFPGTPFQATVAIDGAYLFPGLPAGSYQLNRYWRGLLPCPPPGACGGLLERSDSAQVKIESGRETGDPP